MRIYRLLLRMYPRPWRERYAVEFLALLEDASPKGWARWATAFGMVLGAADAHCRRLRAKTSEPALRSGGCTGLVAGVVFSLGIVLVNVVFESGTDNGLAVLAGYGAIAGLFVVVGARAVTRSPTPHASGVAGAATAFTMVSLVMATFLYAVPVMVPTAGEPSMLGRSILLFCFVCLGTAMGAVLGSLGGHSYARWLRRGDVRGQG